MRFMVDQMAWPRVGRQPEPSQIAPLHARGRDKSPGIGNGCAARAMQLVVRVLLPHRPSPERPKVVACQEKMTVATDARKSADCGDVEGGVREVPMEDGLEAPSVTPKVDADKIAADSFAKDREDFGALAESSKRRKKREERQADEIDKAEDAPGKAKHDE
mmetsp:Transcript_66218/g.193812  ORF Transcript_66218/g.193812 Transcript_66218/m.193812 type:complete len:161 (-) Transcript_66218:315-797(-)